MSPEHIRALITLGIAAPSALACLVLCLIGSKTGDWKGDWPGTASVLAAVGGLLGAVAFVITSAVCIFDDGGVVDLISRLLAP